MQLAITIAIVGLAAAYVIRAAWRTWNGSKLGCASGSGCSRCARPSHDEAPQGRISLPQI